MSEAVRIRKNSFFSLVSSLLRLIGNLVVFWVIGRKLGPEAFGQFTVAHTIAMLWVVFADFGFDVLLTNEIARDRSNARKVFQQYFTLKVIFSVTALIVMWLVAFLSNLSYESRILVLIFSFFMVFSALTNFLCALFRGFELLKYETAISLFVNIGLLLAVSFILVASVNVFLTGLAFTLSRLFGFLIGIRYSYKVLPDISYRLSFKTLGAVRKKVLIFGFHLLFNNLFFQIDTVLLASWKGDHNAGIYQSAFKLILLPLVLPDILASSLMPVLSRFNVENMFQWKRIGYLMNKVLAFIAIPISIVLFVFAEQIINFVYGSNGFEEAVSVLQILSVMLFVRFSLETYSLILTTSERQHVRMWTVILATIVNVALNYFLIPIYGVIGSACVSLFCNATVGLTYALFSAPLFREWSLNSKTAIVYVVSATIALLFWHYRSLNMFIGIPILLLMFWGIAYVYLFSKEEKRVLFSSEFGFSIMK